MTADREAAVAELQRIYDELPAVACKGRCSDSCTSIDMSELERDRLRERGVEIAPRRPVLELLALDRFGQVPRCAALTALNTCSVYEVRPLICRLFGAARGLRCEHGCVPDRELTDAEAFALIARVGELSGQTPAPGEDRPASRWGAEPGGGPRESGPPPATRTTGARS